MNFYDFFLESVSEMLLVHGFGFSVIGFWLIMLFFLRNTQDEKVTKPTTKNLKPKTIAQLTLIFQKAKVKQFFLAPIPAIQHNRSINHNHPPKKQK